MRQLKDLPGCELVAVSDVYEPRVLEAAHVANQSLFAGGARMRFDAASGKAEKV
jgi:hypothetical protein